MNSQLLVRCFQSPQQCVNNIIRINTRCVHKGVASYQDSSKEPASLPEYMKKRQELLKSNPVKHSSGKAQKWDMKTSNINKDERPFHRHMSALLSFTVLVTYLFLREENDIDEQVLLPKKADEYQTILDKMKK